jgi:hypothetical protein
MEENDTIFEETDYTEEYEVERVPEKKATLKEKLLGVGWGGLVVGGSILALFVSVLRFIYVALAGLSMVYYAIVLFGEGSIFLGLLVIVFGTTIAIGIASYFFYPVLLLSIIALIVWGVSRLLGFHAGFTNIWHYTWVGVIGLIFLAVTVFGIIGFVSAIRHKNLKEFLSSNWFYILLYIGIVYYFFF